MSIDPNTAMLAGTVISLLHPYAQKGAEEFAKAAGKAAFEGVQKLVDALRQRFGGDKEAEETLKQFEDKPDRYRAALEDILREKLAQDHGFEAQLRGLLSDMGPTITVIQDLEKAGKVTGLKAKGIHSGTVSVEQHAKQVDDLTGVELDGDIGN